MMKSSPGLPGAVAPHTQRAKHGSWEMLLLLALLPSMLLLNGCAGLVKVSSQTVAAIFGLTPSSVSFGTVTVGKKATQSVSVSNTGTVAVNITQATVSNSQFSFSGVSLPLALSPGQSSSFSVAVTPAAAGNVTGTLTVSGDSGSSPVVANLSATAVAASQPQLSVSPTSIGFGTVSTGQTTSTNLSLSNTGSADLTVSAIAVTGSAFTISGFTTPKTISAGQSAQVAVTFAPTAAGAATGSITITSNDPTNPTLSVPLTGTGSAAATGHLTANPSSVGFGAVATGSSTGQSVVISNTGTAAVTISAVAASGAGYSVSGLTTPATLNPSQTATLTITFAPSGVGSATGSVTLTSNAGNSPLTIGLSGTGTQAGLSVSPASFNFGSVVDGQTSSQSFTITNTGTASLTISQIAASGSGFTVSGLTTPATLAAGGTATFSVLFAPTTAGSLSGSVSITSNAPNSPTVVALSGTGVAASAGLTANPSSLAFGNINAGSSSSKTVTITNSGSTSLTVSQVAVNAKDFAASGITTPLTLAAGQNATLNVSFSPTTSENVTGNITVSSSQGASAVVAVSGSGLQPALTITPASASFGNVTVGTSSTQTIQLSNSGTGTLSITQVSATGSGFSTSSLALPLNLTAGQSTTFNVQFAPASTGAVSGSVTIASNAPNSPATIPLSGTGVAAVVTLSFSTTSLAFGGVSAASSSMLPVTVTNAGNANVQISQISESGSGFTLTGASTPVTLTPNQSTTFDVTFSPTATGNYTGTVTVTSNASNSPATISLSGESHAVTLGWAASTSTVAGYNIYRTTQSNLSGLAPVNSTPVTGLSYVDTTVQGATTYYYVARAVDSSGTESANSNTATAVVP